MFIAGWWLTYPSEKDEFVSWDDDIPNIWKNDPNVPNHQPDNKLFPDIMEHLNHKCSKAPTSECS